MSDLPAGPEAEAPVELTDCASRHMPETRTHDVIEVTMTDHLIRVVDDPPALLGQGETTAAEQRLVRALALDPERPEAPF